MSNQERRPSHNKPRLVPTDLAALAMGVTPSAVRKLASRGRLTRYGTSRRALYDLNEIESAVRDRR